MQTGCQHPTLSKDTTNLKMGHYIPLISHLWTEDTASDKSLDSEYIQNNKICISIQTLKTLSTSFDPWRTGKPSKSSDCTICSSQPTRNPADREALRSQPTPHPSPTHTWGPRSVSRHSSHVDGQTGQCSQFTCPVYT